MNYFEQRQAKAMGGNTEPEQKKKTGIVPRVGVCEICEAKGDSKEKPLIAGKCDFHYRQFRAAICAERKEVRESNVSMRGNPESKSLEAIKSDLDLIFSRWLRLSSADHAGYCFCFICGSPDRWQDMHAAHYIPRGSNLLRYDTRNVTVQCPVCNQVKGGNYVEYTRRLEEENPGITSILEEESQLAYHISRSELKDMISEYSQKLKQLLK